MAVHWPQLAVRTWQGALYGRRPEDWYNDAHDDAEEARESRPLHELRGLVVGQVAEIEGLLRYIASEIRTRRNEELPSRQNRRGAGAALHDLRRLLQAIVLEDEFTEELDTIWQVIQRRNRLVHGRIHVGFSRMGEEGLRSVIVLLFENDAKEGSSSSKDDDDVECDMPELTRYLNEAYAALEAALDVWEKIDQALPSR